ncbi:MAG: succinylglutamate desuccinylase/aspartoacylase family protein [Pseudomonadota bacterium]
MAKTIETFILPPSSPGQSRTLTAIRYGAVSGEGPKAYIQAGLHADEAPGLVVMHHLIDRLDRLEESGGIIGEIILVPAANPIGLSQWRDEKILGRFEFFSNINFNRRHLDILEPLAGKIGDRLTDDPRANTALIRQAAREVLASLSPGDEADALKHRLLTWACDADIVLDLHCDFQALIHVYLGTPLWPDAADLSAQMGAQATFLAEASGGSPFDEACSAVWWRLAEKFPDKPIPPACLAATVELRGQHDVSHELASRDAENIVLFLQRRGLIGGRAPEAPPLPREATPLTAMAAVKATKPGVTVFLKKPGDWVEQGEIIAEIINPLGDDARERVHPVEATTAGLLFALAPDRYARPGRTLAKIAGRIPLKKEGENLLEL